MEGLVRASCWQEGILLSVSWREIDWISTVLVSYWGTFFLTTLITVGNMEANNLTFFPLKRH